jgi:hypothetical protein
LPDAPTREAERTVNELVALGDRAVNQAKLIYPDSFF